MAATNFGSGGFSYAQAARGQTAAVAQNGLKKITETSNPATNGMLSEPTLKSNWADEVENASDVKTSEPLKLQPDDSKAASPKPAPADPAKPDGKTPNGVSGISSPDLTATSSTTTKDDDIPSPRNGPSSESTWEERSQTSEPSWIQEREKRQSQSGSQTTQKLAKSDKHPKPTAAQLPEKAVILQEALPPTVNPWLKRAEQVKAKPVVSPIIPASSSSSNIPASKENQRPQGEARRKANSVTSVLPESSTVAVDAKKHQTGTIQQGNGVLGSSRWPSAKSTSNGTTSDRTLPSSMRAKPFERQSLPSIPSIPAVVDQASWPTPDSVQDKESKEFPERDGEDQHDDDATPTTKRKKQAWNKLEVTPNIIFETLMNEPKGRSRGLPSGERGGKNGAVGRGRGGHRGASNANGGDRQVVRTSSLTADPGSDLSAEPKVPETNVEQQSSSSSRSIRASSASAWRPANSDRTTKRHSEHDDPNGSLLSEKPMPNAVKASVDSVEAQTSSLSQSRHVESTNAFRVQDDEIVPEPIPRRNSLGAQGRKSDGFVAEIARQTATLPRHMPAEARKDSRAFDQSRDAPYVPRTGKRGRGGRGGNGLREQANGHVATNGLPFVPNFPTHEAPSASYPVLRGHQQHAYQAAGRAAWSNRAGPRSQSIPIDNNYYQRPGYHPAGMPPHLAPINTYMAGMYDPSTAPMTAMPYTQHMDPHYLAGVVMTQLEYYFSVDNLLKDMFLRRNMDSQGFVFMDIVANFNRVKQLTQDREIIKVACMNSQVIQIRVGEDGRERLRNPEMWDQFLLPVDQREESAQNDGPAQLRRPDKPLQMAGTSPHYRGTTSAGFVPSQHLRYDRRSYDSVYPTMNGAQAHFGAYGRAPEIVYGDLPNGEETRGRAAKSPIHETPVSPTNPAMSEALDEMDSEPDTFPDSQISVLTVVVNMSQQQAQPATQQPAQQQRQPYHSLASRTFSNGSIDSRSLMSDIDRSSDVSGQAQKDGQTIVNGSERHLPPVPRRPSPNKPRSNDRAPNDSDLAVFWVKDRDVPVVKLPSDLTSEPYVQLRLKALDQRNHAATGNCPYDMDVLYQFWCHFLIRNFNKRMYSEFKLSADQDIERHSLVGVQNLLKFYGQSLLSVHPIRDRVVKDYVHLVKNEPSALQGMAFKQLRSAWRNGALNLKNRKKLADIVDEKLKEQLDRLDA